VAHDAAGSAVALWTTSDGTLQTARQVVGQNWSRSVVLYTPSRLCVHRDQRCTVDQVTPRSLVINAAGQAFFIVVQHVVSPDRATCDHAVAGRVSTHRTGGQIGALSVHYGQSAAAERHRGKFFEPVTAISPDGTGALAYIRDEPTQFESSVFFGTFPRGSITADVTGGAGCCEQKSSKPVGLTVGIDNANHATLLYHQSVQPMVLLSQDIVGGSVVNQLVSMAGERGLGTPLNVGPASLTIAADGSQQTV